jgi:hypothetical protein
MAPLEDAALTHAPADASLPGMATPVTRERYEWSNNWWDHADDAVIPRVLLIGDSICCGYGPVVTGLLEGCFHVDRMANSRGVHDPILFKEVEMALADRPYRAIHFNNGLHAVHLADADYERGLRAYVRLLRDAGGAALLVWASSTPVTRPVPEHPLDEVRNAQVVRRNALAASVMEEHGIRINDLYALVLGRNDLRAPDGYHYNEEGYRLMGSAVAEVLRERSAPRSGTTL